MIHMYTDNTELNSTAPLPVFFLRAHDSGEVREPLSSGGWGRSHTSFRIDAFIECSPEIQVSYFICSTDWNF